MRNQRQAAAKAMIEWLSDERELGHAPEKIKCAGEFDLYSLHYYIFKFRKSRFGRWLIGVSGGYRGDSTEHCGHVFSEMEPYSPYTAKEYCISMVELVREYWMDQAMESSFQAEDENAEKTSQTEDGQLEKKDIYQDQENAVHEHHEETEEELAEQDRPADETLPADQTALDEQLSGVESDEEISYEYYNEEDRYLMPFRRINTMDDASDESYEHPDLFIADTPDDLLKEPLSRHYDRGDFPAPASQYERSDNLMLNDLCEQIKNGLFDQYVQTNRGDALRQSEQPDEDIDTWDNPEDQLTEDEPEHELRIEAYGNIEEAIPEELNDQSPQPESEPSPWDNSNPLFKFRQLSSEDVSEEFEEQPLQRGRNPLFDLGKWAEEDEPDEPPLLSDSEAPADEEDSDRLEDSPKMGVFERLFQADYRIPSESYEPINEDNPCHQSGQTEENALYHINTYREEEPQALFRQAANRVLSHPADETDENILNNTVAQSGEGLYNHQLQGDQSDRPDQYDLIDENSLDEPDTQIKQGLPDPDLQAEQPPLSDEFEQADENNSDELCDSTGMEPEDQPSLTEEPLPDEEQLTSPLPSGICAQETHEESDDIQTHTNENKSILYNLHAHTSKSLLYELHCEKSSGFSANQEDRNFTDSLYDENILQNEDILHEEPAVDTDELPSDREIPCEEAAMPDQSLSQSESPMNQETPFAHVFEVLKRVRQEASPQAEAEPLENSNEPVEQSVSDEDTIPALQDLLQEDAAPEAAKLLEIPDEPEEDTRETSKLQDHPNEPTNQEASAADIFTVLQNLRQNTGSREVSELLENIEETKAQAAPDTDAFTVLQNLWQNPDSPEVSEPSENTVETKAQEAPDTDAFTVLQNLWQSPDSPEVSEPSENTVETKAQEASDDDIFSVLQDLRQNADSPEVSEPSDNADEPEASLEDVPPTGHDLPQSAAAPADCEPAKRQDESIFRIVFKRKRILPGSGALKVRKAPAPLPEPPAKQEEALPSSQELQTDRQTQEQVQRLQSQPSQTDNNLHHNFNIHQNRQAKDIENSWQPGPIGGFILLSSNSWDVGMMKMYLRREWGIVIPEQQGGVKVHNKIKNAFIWKESGMTVAVSLNQFPVPEGEAEEKAAGNFFWPEAVEVTQTHKAHILIAVLPGRRSAIEAGKLCVKLCASCSKLDNALGIYTAGTVFHPDFYRKAAGGMKDGDLPILNWIYFGLTPSYGGLNGYTYGMEDFGLEELEVIDSQAAPQDLYGFLVDMVSYIMVSGVRLKPGDTFGFTENQKLPVTRSEGVCVDGYSLKIGYKPARYN